MIEKTDPSRLLEVIRSLLSDLDLLGADIAAARLSGVIDALHDQFDLDQT